MEILRRVNRLVEDFIRKEYSGQCYLPVPNYVPDDFLDKDSVVEISKMVHEAAEIIIKAGVKHKKEVAKYLNDKHNNTSP